MVRSGSCLDIPMEEYASSTPQGSFMPQLFKTSGMDSVIHWHTEQRSFTPSTSSEQDNNYSTYTSLETYSPEPYQNVNYCNLTAPRSTGSLPSLGSYFLPMTEDNNLVSSYGYGPGAFKLVDAAVSASHMSLPSMKDDGLYSSSSSTHSSPARTLYQLQQEAGEEAGTDSGFGECEIKSENFDQLEVKTQCVKCGTSATDLWHHDGTGHFLCNLCHLYRPQEMAQEVVDDTEESTKRRKSMNAFKKLNQKCTNCETVVTSLWRRNNNGEFVCNACGLYEKLHKCPRPLSMKKDAIQTRKRKPRSSESKKNFPNNFQMVQIKQEVLHSSVHEQDDVSKDESGFFKSQTPLVLPSISNNGNYYKPVASLLSSSVIPSNNLTHLTSLVNDSRNFNIMNDSS